MAIANGTCVSFCNQPKAHYLATSRESRRYVVACTRFAGGCIWLPLESLKHILASLGTPWVNRGKCHMDRQEFNACQTSRSMYSSIFNRFPVIQAGSIKVRHFSTFLHIFASPGYAPGTIAVYVTRLERGFNACKMPRCI